MFPDMLPSDSEEPSSNDNMIDTDTFDPESCNLLSSSSVTLNNIKSEEVSFECIIDGAATQSKGYAFAPADNSLITLSLIANSDSLNQYSSLLRIL